MSATAHVLVLPRRALEPPGAAAASPRSLFTWGSTESKPNVLCRAATHRNFPVVQASNESQSGIKQEQKQKQKQQQQLTSSIGSDDVPKKKSRPPPGPLTSWFLQSYHQYKGWPEIHKLLTERDVTGVECQEAYDLAKSGFATLIDVREAQAFEKVHAQGSFGAPLFRQIEGNDLKANLRRFGYALLTNFAGTERNPNFINQALQAVNGDKKKRVVVLCDIGGTLSTFIERTGPKAKKFADPERRFGRPSRALKAVFELQEEGFTNVTYTTGGLNTWIHKNLPIDVK